MTFNLTEWYNNKISGDVLFSYKGAITSDKITRFLENIEQKIEVIDESQKLKRKIYNILVECLQNIYHHGDIIFKEVEEAADDNDYNEKSKFGVLIFAKAEIGYVIHTGNFVSSAKEQILKDKLDQLSILSNEEIKALYKLILNNHEFSERGGGGLGIIDIYKRADNKINYNFNIFNSEKVFYSIEINVF